MKNVQKCFASPDTFPFDCKTKKYMPRLSEPAFFRGAPQMGSQDISPSYGTFLTSAPSPKMDKPQYYPAMIFGNSRLMTSAIMRFIFQSP